MIINKNLIEIVVDHFLQKFTYQKKKELYQNKLYINNCQKIILKIKYQNFQIIYSKDSIELNFLVKRII